MKDASNVLMGSEAKGKDEIQQPLHQSQILPSSIFDKHISGSVLQIGQSSALPDGSTHTKIFYELDSKKLKIWNSDNDEWDEVQLA